MNALMKSHMVSVPMRRIMKSVTVNRSAMRLYHEWRNLTRSRAATLRGVGIRTSINEEATIRVPRVAETGSLTAGEAELSLAIPGLLIAWTSRSGHASVQNGEVWFSPLPPDCSEVRLILTWQSDEFMPNDAGEAGETAVQVERELTRFKQLMEQ